MYPFTNYSEDIELATKARRAQSDAPDLACIIFRDAYNAVPEGIVSPAAALPMLRRT